MSRKPDSLSSIDDRPAVPFPLPLAPLSAAGPETVLNPERRGAPGPAVPLPMPDSGVWRRLFPSEYDQETIGPADFELEHFVIEERIGAGGMGAVFRAVDQRLQRVVALKVLAPHQSRDLSSLQRFQNEARAAARLDHDNIARVYYFGEDQGLQFIAFEYVTGINVRDLIRQEGRLEPGEAVNFTLQIAAALKHTAAAGVVHRDIKPSNIIITPAGRAKLVDLGLARKQNSESIGDLTIAGTTLGTFDYISPEQAKDPRNVDIRADIYSLGCTLYHMLTGEPPYPDGTVLQKLLDHQGKDPPDPALKNRRVPPNLSAVVQKMMASDPRQRYATPDDLMRDLMVVAASLGLRGRNPEGLVWSTTAFARPPFWRRHVGWLATAAALLVIVIVLERFPGMATPPRLSTPPADGKALAAGRLPHAKSGEPHGSTMTNDRETVIDDTPTTRSPDVPEWSRVPAGANRPADSFEPGSVGGSTPEGASESAGGLSLLESNGENLLPGRTLLPDPGELFREPLSPAFADALGPLGLSPLGDLRLRDVPADSPMTPMTPPPAVAVKPAEPPPGRPNGESSRPSVPSVPIVDAPAIYLLSGTESRGYARLEAACAAAEDGDVIELRYNGPRSEAETPLKISGKRVYIRAAKGFRPQIEFAPVEIPAQGYGTRMITVENGQVDLINVDVRIQVRSDVELRNDQVWALFSLQGAENDRVLLQNVSVTISNPGSRPAVLFELTSGPGRALSKMQMMGGTEDESRSRFEVSVVDSLLRGGCDLFMVRHTLPGDLSMTRSVFAVDGAGLLALGDLETPAEYARLKWKMEHVTGISGNSLVHVETGDLGRRVLPLHIRAQNTLLATTTSAPLTAMTGNTDADDLRGLLRWSGENNCYDRFETFWTISSLQGTAETIAYDFEEWKAAWTAAGDTGEVKPVASGVAWRNDWWLRETADLIGADLELDRDSADNPAVGGATDGESDVGADLTKIPLLPAAR